MFSEVIFKKSKELLNLCRSAGYLLATAESCTGGLVAGCLTEIPGSSDVVERGFICYSNESKIEQLGVTAELIDTFGAVSAEVAGAMANGAINRSHANLALSITGIAGPGGETKNKPVGLVYLGTSLKAGSVNVIRQEFVGDRQSVRVQAVETALDLMLKRLSI